MHPDFTFHLSPIPYLLLLRFPSKKRTDLPEISTKNGIKRCNKTRHNPHFETEQGNPVGGKRFHEKAKESEIPSLSLLRIPQTPS